MATLNSTFGSSSSNRDAPFRVSTREVSLDFATVGPAQSAQELGAMSSAAFGELLAKFAAIPTVKLIDGDPLLVVTAKRGRYTIVPSGGKLLVRPAHDPQQPYLKFDVAPLVVYLDSTDHPTPTELKAEAKKIEAVITAATAPDEVAVNPPPPALAAPIYGSFPSAAPRPGAPNATVTGSAAAPTPGRPANRSPLLTAGAILLALGALGAGWVFFGPASAPLPPLAPPTGDYDLVTSQPELDRLRQRLPGTYATSGSAGERILEIRTDGTFRYQEFGSGLARTTDRRGHYIFAFRRSNHAPVLRAGDFGTIEIRDEKTLFCQQAVFTRLP